MNSSTILTVLGSLLALLLVAAGSIGAWAALRVGRQTQTVKNFRDAAQSWREKSEAQEAEITELRHENDTLRREVADLRGQIAVLRDMVTGVAAVKEHDTKVELRHDEIMKQLACIEDLVRSEGAS